MEGNVYCTPHTTTYVPFSTYPLYGGYETLTLLRFFPLRLRILFRRGQRFDDADDNLLEPPTIQQCETDEGDRDRDVDRGRGGRQLGRCLDLAVRRTRSNTYYYNADFQ